MFHLTLNCSCLRTLE
uniref:Uncharacterized protein n=1 Tax=Anguilla anguilla TaxID=7936 RepID=A0A0E9Q3Q9_ANGAN